MLFSRPVPGISAAEKRRPGLIRRFRSGLSKGDFGGEVPASKIVWAARGDLGSRVPRMGPSGPRVRRASAGAFAFARPRPGRAPTPARGPAGSWGRPWASRASRPSPRRAAGPTGNPRGLLRPLQQIRARTPPDHPVDRRASLRERRRQTSRASGLPAGPLSSALQSGRGARVDAGEVLDQFGHVADIPMLRSPGKPCRRVISPTASTGKRPGPDRGHLKFVLRRPAPSRGGIPHQLGCLREQVIQRGGEEVHTLHCGRFTRHFPQSNRTNHTRHREFSHGTVGA